MYILHEILRILTFKYSYKKTLLLFEGNTLSEIKALIGKQAAFAADSEEYADLKSLQAYTSELQNLATINDLPGFLGTLSETIQKLQQLKQDNSPLQQTLAQILQENVAIYNQLANGDATLFDITHQIQHVLNLLLDGLQNVYGEAI